MLKKINLFLLIIILAVPISAKDVRLELTSLIKGAFAKQKSLSGVIDLATNNKMLSQKMAKCAVLIKNGISVESNHKILIQSAKEFDSFIDGMYNGNESLKLKKESDKQVLKELDEVNEVWKEFQLQVKNLYKDGKVNKDAYKYIIDNNEKLLRISHKLTQTIQSKVILNTNDNQVIVNTLKFADRQKMLTQKMLKEKFLVYTKENAKRNNVKLRGSIILFRNGLNGLMNGDDKRGIAKVTSKPIQQKLKEMQVLYNESEELYIKHNVNFDEIKGLAVLDRKLLDLSIEVVTMIKNTLVY
jgi:hypothetical protein